MKIDILLKSLVLSVLVSVCSLTLISADTSAETVSSGTCGAELVWSISDNGVLTISGTGDMCDYFNVYGPWFEQNADDIQEIVIEEGVTSIGISAFANLREVTAVQLPNSLMVINNEAFANCISIEEINIPESVIKIGEVAFYNCRSLTHFTWPSNIQIMSDGVFRYCFNLNSITLPDNLLVIGNYEFEGCIYLKNFNIPESCTVIGEGAFLGCSSLESIFIPKDVKQIGNGAFNCYALQAIEVDIQNQFFKAADNVLYSKDGTRLITFPFSKTGKDVTFSIPEGVKEIDDDAFSRGIVYNENGGSTGYACRFDTLIFPSTYTIVTGGSNGGVLYDKYIKNVHLSGAIEKLNKNSMATGKIDNLYIPRGIAPSAPATSFSQGVVGTIHVPEGSKGYDKSPWTKSKVIYDLAPILLKGFRFDCDEYYVCIEQEQSIKVIPIPFDATEPYTTIYSSSDSNIATASDDGMVTPVSLGTVSLHVASEEYNTSCTIHVVDHQYTSWRMTKDSTQLEKGVEEKECKICGKKVSKEIPFLNDIHNASFVLPRMTQIVQEYAFSGIPANIIYCQNGIKGIEKCAFSECESLDAIYIPNTVGYIADDAFDHCNDGICIFGYKDSYAQEYADSHSFVFIIIDDNES